MSNRSRFITLFHAAAKSLTNVSLASSQAYLSAMARNSEFEPKMRSTLVPFQRTSPELLLFPSKTSSTLETAFHFVPKSRRCTKKSFESAPGRFVKTPVSYTHLPYPSSTEGSNKKPPPPSPKMIQVVLSL